ncbi:alanine--tRNA ligase [Acidimicrobiaceae bacterium]|nr:alanine--tRNA ligase [Acidimicrobiaceae bacterium]
MTSEIRSANDLRNAFTGFFTERGHTKVDSASLIPHDPTVLFTVAGMVPFKPFFVGDEVPPYKRAVSVQSALEQAANTTTLTMSVEQNVIACFSRCSAILVSAIISNPTRFRGVGN